MKRPRELKQDDGSNVKTLESVHRNTSSIYSFFFIKKWMLALIRLWEYLMQCVKHRPVGDWRREKENITLQIHKFSYDHQQRIVIQIYSSSI